LNLTKKQKEGASEKMDKKKKELQNRKVMIRNSIGPNRGSLSGLIAREGVLRKVVHFIIVYKR